MERIYLDHNATTPLRDTARAEMIAAMEVVGNPSSMHLEGRTARALVEKAREDLASAIGADGADVIFTSGATEAASLALSGRVVQCANIEHDAVLECCDASLGVDFNGMVDVSDPANAALQCANSETGVMQNLPKGLFFSDMTQAFGKTDIIFNCLGVHIAAVSAHKIGGPKGIGALILRPGIDLKARIKGGGQELGRRSGTENVIGIVGFGAAALAAQKELREGSWDRVEELRNYLEAAIVQMFPEAICVGEQGSRLQNTSCIVSPGWKADKQVMQMDLEGFAISAGAACSSGKVKGSRVLSAMGFDSRQSECGIRVSLSTQTTKEHVERFLDCWAIKRKKIDLRRSV